MGDLELSLQVGCLELWLQVGLLVGDLEVSLQLGTVVQVGDSLMLFQVGGWRDVPLKHGCVLTGVTFCIDDEIDNISSSNCIFSRVLMSSLCLTSSAASS